MTNEIFVLIEYDEDGIKEVSLEILGEACRLARISGSRVSAIVLGQDISHLIEPLGRYGAHKVYLADNFLLKHYATDGYCKVLQDFFKIKNSALLLMGSTALGKDLAPFLAIKLQCGLSSDCAVLKFQSKGVLEMIRPIYGGRVYAGYAGSESGLQIVTIQPGILGVDPSPHGRIPDVEKIEVILEPGMIRTKHLGYTEIEKEKLDISEADNVFAVGKGLGDASKMPLMLEAARLMDASHAGSRAAVDEGWIHFERQIGQTGKTISPKLIICCGISGAQQFTMGMRDSKFIVAVNIDRNAPIFNVADISILGDMHEIIPMLVEKMQAQRSEKNKKG